MQLIGKGAGGEVYLAVDNHLPGSPQVALKMRAQDVIDARAIERFRREVILLRKLSHENIIQIFEFACNTTTTGARGQYFFVMEYVPGATIRQLLDDAPIPFPVVLRLFKQLLHALIHAHTAGVLHRDLKPELHDCDRTPPDQLAAAIENSGRSDLREIYQSLVGERSSAAAER